MNKDTVLNALETYIERTKEILELSSPQLTGIDSAEHYRIHLQRSFTKIGELAAENNETLLTYFYPLVDNEREASKEDVEIMHKLCTMLNDATSMENLDLPLIQRMSERILEAADSKGGLRERVLARDNMVISAYMMLNMTVRLYPDLDICYRFRDLGFEAGRRLLRHLDPELFAALPDDECRELVLINARYIRCMFEWDDQEDMTPINARDLEMMRRALSLTTDPFYRELMPDYSWEIHEFRTLQYLADFPENHNRHGFDHDQMTELTGYAQRLCDYIEKHPDLTAGCPEIEQQFYVMRDRYLTGEFTLAEHKKNMRDLMARRDPNDFSARSMLVNFIIPFEYILSLDREEISDEDAGVVAGIYHDIASYAYHLPKSGVLSFMLTFLADLLRHYIEVPGGMDFMTMCQRLLAAMHPPTYVHTLNVANLARFMAEKLIERQPELFTGVLDTADTGEVTARSGEILEFVHQASLLHDIGKLFIVETIITYGRTLLDEEFELIKAHPVVGASLLKQFPGTAPYAEMALGHHKWYDDSAGYPDDFRMSESKNRVVIALIAAADCLDAATDSIGRSYKKGKTLDDYIGEVREGSGTRYAPYLIDLLTDPDVREGLNRLLSEGRDENYRRTYEVLKGL